MTNWNDFQRDRILIDGAWVAADGGQTITVTDPASGAVIGTVPRAGAAETRRAIEAAHRAFEGFSQTTAARRAEWLRQLAAAIMDQQAPLAELLTREQGKPLVEAKAEVAMSAAYIQWFAEEARRLYGETIPSPWQDRRILVAKAPVGVVGAITPWNFPSSMLARKIGPALAAGCTIVAKPASQTPFSALAWGVLAEQIGLPDGVLNIVTGDAKQIGDELTSHPLVRKITFTGSTAIGKTLIGRAAETVKKVSMELGGNAPFIVFDDADLDAAVAGAVAAKFRNAGQTCVCTNRIYVQAGIHDRFVAAFVAATRQLVLGPGLDSASTLGPLIDVASVRKVEDLLADAVGKGAYIATGGMRDERGARFFQPTVITRAQANMQLAREEIFGPLAPIFQFKTEDEVVAMANDTEFGLAAYFYTRDVGRVFRLSDRLQYGLVGINEGIITTEVAPFGGLKQSGIGKEGSRHGVEDYLDTKYLCIGGLGI